MILSTKVLDIKDVKLFNLNSYCDKRGSFLEVFKSNLDFKEFKLNYVQENESKSKYGVFRGMHFQKGIYSQAKLLRVVNGKILDFICDLREGSPTFKKIISIELTNENILFLPKGMAHGFLALEDDSIINYKCDNYYNPKYECGFNLFSSKLDLDLNFNKKDLIISKKDKKLKDLNQTYFFRNI